MSLTILRDYKPILITVTLVGKTGPQGPMGPLLADLPRGQISIQNGTTPTDIITAGVFVPAGVNGTLDASVSIDFETLSDGDFAMRYTCATTRTFWIFGSFDCSDGNNRTLAIRMAKNGTAIPETECRAFTSSGGAEAKLVSNWMIELATDDEISLIIANITHADDITIRRGRLVVNSIP
jgi:hypothetical protein